MGQGAADHPIDLLQILLDRSGKANSSVTAAQVDLDRLFTFLLGKVQIEGESRGEFTRIGVVACIGSRAGVDGDQVVVREVFNGTLNIRIPAGLRMLGLL